MLKVLMAAALEGNIQEMFEGDAYNQLLFIVLIGLIIQFGINAFFSMVLIREKYAATFVVVCISESLVAVSLFLLSWCYIGLEYNYVIAGLTVFEIIGNSLYLLLYYCVYILPNIEWIWIISEIFFCIYFVILARIAIKIKIKEESEESEESELFRPGYKF